MARTDDAIQDLFNAMSVLCEKKIVIGSGSSQTVSSVIQSYSISDEKIEIEFSELVRKTLAGSDLELTDLTDFLVDPTQEELEKGFIALK